MVDPITLTALIGGIGSLLVSLITHIKFSKCYGFEMKTTSHNSGQSTPLITPDPNGAKMYRTTPINISK